MTNFCVIKVLANPFRTVYPTMGGENIVLDIQDAERDNMTMNDLLREFRNRAGKQMDVYGILTN